MVRSLLEIGFGAAYGVGAVFNIVHTLRHGDDFYGGFVRGAWFAPGRWFVERVVLSVPSFDTTESAQKAGLRDGSDGTRTRALPPPSR